MRNCELCESTAKVFCESDQASLCWDCDGKVHGANFLVARHSRSLLCHACCSPTPWNASGPKLGHTVSLCARCVCGVKNRGERRDQIEDDEEVELEVEVEVEEKVKEKDGDNQEVPWSFTPPPPSAASSSSSEASETRFSSVKSISLKRMRNDLDCSSSQRNRNSELTAVMTADSTVDGEITNSGPFSRWKNRQVRVEDCAGTDNRSVVENRRDIDLNSLPESAGVPI